MRPRFMFHVLLVILVASTLGLAAPTRQALADDGSPKPSPTAGRATVDALVCQSYFGGVYMETSGASEYIQYGGWQTCNQSVNQWGLVYLYRFNGSIWEHIASKPASSPSTYTLNVFSETFDCFSHTPTLYYMKYWSTAVGVPFVPYPATSPTFGPINCRAPKVI